jgi:hypothetical protein
MSRGGGLGAVDPEDLHLVVLHGVEIAVPEELVVAFRKRVDTVFRLAVLAVALGVVRAAQHDGALVAGRPLLDLPGSRLLRIAEVEMEVERAHVGLVVHLARVVLAVAFVDLHGAVVAGVSLDRAGDAGARSATMTSPMTATQPSHRYVL